MIQNITIAPKPRRKKNYTLLIVAIVLVIVILIYYQVYKYLENLKVEEEIKKQQEKETEQVKKVNEEIKKIPSAKKRTYYTVEQIANCLQGFKPLGEAKAWTIKAIGEATGERLNLCLNANIVGVWYNYKGKSYYSPVNKFWEYAKSAGITDTFIAYYIPTNFITGAKGMLQGEFKEFAYAALKKLKNAGYTDIYPFSGEY